MLNRTLELGTDVAAFFVFHPDDLAHRKEAPLDWYSYDFAVSPEFAQGRLIAFSTGSDGGYRFRLTDGDLNAEEQKAMVGSWEFGYAVRHGKTFLDNSDCLPSDDQMEEADKHTERWIELPNGTYRVTVSAIAHETDEESNEKAATSNLPDYVMRFQAEADLSAVSPPPTMPILSPWPGHPPQLSPSSSAEGYYEKLEKEPLQEAYPLLEVDKPLVPGKAKTFPISDALYELLEERLFGDEETEIRDLLCAASSVPGTLGTLGRISGTSRTEGEPGDVSVSGTRLVQIVGPAEGEKVTWVRVEPLHRDEKALSAEEIGALKAEFEAYTRTNPVYRKKVKHPDFERERVMAMTTSSKLTSALLQHVQMTPTVRQELLPLSDAERAQRLRTLMHAE